MQCKEVVKTLTKACGVSGYEDSVSSIIQSIFSEYCDQVRIDSFNNVIGRKTGYGDNKKKILITAHLDEIGLMITGIDKNGFLKFCGIGGVDAKILLCQEVIIHGRKDIYGIIGAKPPHLLDNDEANKVPDIKDMRIDTGLSDDEIKKYIRVGDTVTFVPHFEELKNNRVSSKSMDNRSGVAALIETMKEIEKIKHDSDIYFVATVQEEVGLRGAIITSYNINPDIGIVIDVCHGDIAESFREESYELGKGVAIGVGPILNKKHTNNIIDIAKKYNIPYQIDVEWGNTGTEAAALQISREGIPVVLLSIPLRYMHTTVEMLSIDDIISTSRLCAKFIEDN